MNSRPKTMNTPGNIQVKSSRMFASLESSRLNPTPPHSADRISMSIDCRCEVLLPQELTEKVLLTLMEIGYSTTLPLEVTEQYKEMEGDKVLTSYLYQLSTVLLNSHPADVQLSSLGVQRLILERVTPLVLTLSNLCSETKLYRSLHTYDQTICYSPGLIMSMGSPEYWTLLQALLTRQPMDRKTRYPALSQLYLQVHISIPSAMPTICGDSRNI